jgi:predicted metal-binding membrane protein
METTREAIRKVTIHRTAIAGSSIVGVAWALLGVLTMAGVHEQASHDALLAHGHHGLGITQLLVFLGLWALMAVAMMLPPTLPAIAAHAENATARHVTSAIAAIVAVWSGFAVAALAGDAVVHELVESGTVPGSVQATIPAFVLIMAGIFQLSPVKRRLLAASRPPVAPWRHAVACVGSCWALMLVMFALGTGSLLLMGVLTAVMMLEQLVPRGEIVASLAGVALFAVGLVLLVT